MFAGENCKAVCDGLIAHSAQAAIYFLFQFLREEHAQALEDEIVANDKIMSVLATDLQKVTLWKDADVDVNCPAAWGLLRELLLLSARTMRAS